MPKKLENLAKVIKEWYRTDCRDMRFENVWIGRDKYPARVKEARPKYSDHSGPHESMADWWSKR